MTEFERRFEEEFEKQKRETQKPNLMLVGGTGVGKSSLINRIFGVDKAKTGEGRPITQGIDRYERENLPVVFYDTEGYEVAKDGTQSRTNFETKILPEIERMNAGELKDHIHLVWYCISISNHRVTKYDIQNIQDFTRRNMKIAVVFTQCDNDEELPNGSGKDASAFKATIGRVVSGLSYFETSNKPNFPLELEALIAWSGDALPNKQLKQSFIAAQKVSITSKKKLAYAIVLATTGTTGLTGALNPLPVSDALLITPQQLAMCMAITKIFWLGVSLSETAEALLKSQLVSLAGKQIAASLLKLIPGIGQVINGVVAAGITGGLGAVLVEGNAKALGEFLDTGKLPDWSVIFGSTGFLNTIRDAIKSKAWEK